VQIVFCLKEQASVYTSLDSPRLDATR
jgi:hypothetical protein